MQKFIRSVIFLVAAPVFAQTGAGSVQGTVRDSSDAAIPSARVQLTHAATASHREASANSSGIFVFPSIPVGEYKIRVESPGMQPWTAQVSVQTGQTVVLTPTLAVASTTDAITVLGDVSTPVNLDNATVGATLERQRIEQLPLNGRSLSTLIGATAPGIEGGNRAFGLPIGALEYVQDGAVLANRDSGGMTARPPGLDSVEEFRVETSNSSAKMNRPATVILATRSGTNRLHGSAFETARNNAIGVARRRQDYYDKPAHLVRNEFGVSVGGPVYVPKLYNGKNRTFFFANFEGYRNHSASTISGTVTTVAMRQGDFSGLVDGSGRKYTIYDPWSTDSKTWARQPFSGNQIPIQRISPLAKYLYSITPAPTFPNVNPMVSSNYFAPGPSVQSENTVTFKIDQNAGDRDRLFMRYSHGGVYSFGPSGIPTLGQEANVSLSPARNESSVLSWTHTISPTFFSETVGNWSYQWTSAAGGRCWDWESVIGLPNPMHGCLLPLVGNAGFYDFTTGNERNNRTWIVSLDQNFTKVRGRHQFQFGARLRDDRSFEMPDGTRDGNHNFNGTATGLYDPKSGTAYTAVSATGHNSANLFLGLAGSYLNRYVQGMYHIREHEYAGYFQDDWKASPRLTLNFGIRYEYHPPLSERDNLLSSFDLKQKAIVTGSALEDLYAMGRTTPAIIQGYSSIGVKFETAEQAGLPSKLIHGYPWNFGPRAGFAYRVTTGSRPLVLRGGFSSYFYPPPIRNFYANMRQSPPFTADYSVNFNSTALSPDGLPNYSLRSVPQYVAGLNTKNIIDFGVPPVIARGGFTTYYMDPDEPTTRASNWSLTLERQLSDLFVAKATYLGNHGSNLEQWSLLNEAPPSYVWYASTGVPLPTGTYAGVATRSFDNQTYGVVQGYEKSGWSNSNGVQIEIERRYKKGYGFQFFYVMTNAYRAGGNGWRDDPLQAPNVFLPGAVPTDENQRNRFLNYQRDTDLPKHRLRWNWLLDLPVGREKLIARNSGRLQNAIIGGWQLAGFGSIRSNYWSLPTSNWGPVGKVEIYGTKYKIEDCRSGRCIPGYLYWNGYIPANRINSYDAQGRPNGVMGVPESYKPVQAPITPTPASPIPGDPNAPYYETNTVWVQMANGQRQQVGYNNNLHPLRNQYLPGPSTFSVDASLFKNARVGERINLRLNVDFFNVLNMPGLNQPGSNGIISLQSSGQSARQLQLSMRLSW